MAVPVGCWSFLAILVSGPCWLAGPGWWSWLAVLVGWQSLLAWPVGGPCWLAVPVGGLRWWSWLAVSAGHPSWLTVLVARVRVERRNKKVVRCE